MRRALPIAKASVLLAAASFSLASPGAKPKPKPAPPPPVVEEPTPPPPKKATKRVRVELAVCRVEDLAELEPKALMSLLRKCESLPRGERDAPVEVRDEQMIVAVCLAKEGDRDEPVETRACSLKATVSVGGGKLLALGADGDLALALRTAKLARDASPQNGTTIELSATWSPDGETEKTARGAMVWHKSVEGYNRGRAIWFPLPMLTSDLSSSPGGYRLGITPLAVAVGLKWFPSERSSGYLGVSPFVAWNLLVPNDTQTLSNGTSVRINYKAAGAGVLLDVSGWFGVGVGIGRTFTTDSRTDLRTWLYFGPRLLGGLNEF